VTLSSLDCRKRLGLWLAALVSPIVALALALAGPVWADDEPHSELEGAWLVITHFQDDSTANPEVMRWSDEVWVFEMKGSRLQWTKYPFVTFEDQTGRFEPLGNNPRSRVLAAWEPNEGQMAELMGGPRVISRGSKIKTLRGSDDKGWRTLSRMQVRSATTIGYQENWSVVGLPDKPVFVREEVMGSGIREKMEGRTVYAATEWGEVPRGTFERDGIRHGTFLMLRTPPVRSAAPTGGSPNDRAVERARQQYLEELGKREGEAP
jgi:hypothetical protein